MPDLAVVQNIDDGDAGGDDRFEAGKADFLHLLAQGPLDIFGVEERPEVVRTQAEIALLKRKIGLIARVFSRTYGMKILPSPNNQWCCGIDQKFAALIGKFIDGEINSLDELPPAALKPTSLYYKIADVETKAEDVVLGFLRHEVGHAVNTDYRLFFEGQRFAKEDGYHPSSFVLIYNALEDPWVNNKEIGDSEVAHQKLSAAYRTWIVEVIDKINTQPITLQLGLNIVYYWLTGENIPTLTDPRVLEVFEGIRPYVDQYFEAKTAAQAQAILRGHIWDRYKVLERRAVEDEKVKELMRKMSGSSFGGKSEPPQSGQGQSGKPQEQQGENGQPQDGQSSGSQGQPQNGQQSPQSGQGSPSGHPSQQSPQSSPNGSSPNPSQSATPGKQPSRGKGLLDRLRDGLRKAAGQAGTPGKDPAKDHGKDPTAEGGQAAPKDAPPKDPSGLDKVGDPQTREAVRQEMQRQEDLARQRSEHAKSEGAQKEEIPDDIDLSTTPPDLLERLRKLIEGLKPAQRDALEKAATAQVDRKQAEDANKHLPPGITMEKDPKTGEYKPALNPVDPEGAERVERQVQEHSQEAATQAAATAEDVKAALDKANQEAERLRKAEEKRKQMIREGFNHPEDIQFYDLFKRLERAMDQQIRTFIDQLRPFLPKKLDIVHSGEFHTGTRIDKKKLIRKIPVGDTAIFQRREAKESEDPQLIVELIIDNSGSMSGPKMEESLKTAIFLARVLREFGMPFAIRFLGDHVDHIMTLGDDYDDPRKKIKPTLVKKADASGRHTDIYTPLHETVEELVANRRKYPDCATAIIVISDSGANAGELTGKALGEYIHERQKTHIITNMLLSGQAGDIREAQRLFGERNVVIADVFPELPAKAFKVLRDIFTRIIRRKRQS